MISAHHRGNPNMTRSYATDADFQQLFATEINDLYYLSLQLTADTEKADHCLTLAKKDCLSTNRIIKNFAPVWARRMVIRNAIHLVLGTDRDTGFEFHLHSIDLQKEEQLESIAVLQLPKIDRLAFVICVLERLSIQDCALLLGESQKEVHEAIVRAANRITSVASFCRTCLDRYDSRHAPRELPSNCHSFPEG